LTACRELHKDEADPELMFQDFEGFPRAYYSESSVSDELFDWLEMDEHDRELLEVYLENIDQSGTLVDAQDAFVGQGETIAQWAEQYLEDCGDLQNVPENLRYHIDFDSWARDSGFSFIRHNGELWVFS
jgi:antirestriction protein